MNTIRNTTIALMLATLPLVGACSQQPDPPRATSSATAEPQTALGKTVASAIEEARHELETGNLDISDGVNIDFGKEGHHVEVGGDETANLPHAEITPQGDLLIEGKAVDVTPAQRAMLLDYRGQVIAVAEAGMEIGVKGADLAGKAMWEAVTGVLHGDTDGIEKRMEAEGRKLEAEARKLCMRLPAMLDSQERLAASLPAFKPYARMTAKDIDDCADGEGFAATDSGSGTGAAGE